MIIANAKGIYILLNENSFKYFTIAIIETTALAIKYNILVKFLPDMAISTKNPENNKNTTYVISVNSLLFFTL